VKILRYTIPHDVISAIWRLQLVATDSCPPTNVYFYLDYAAYPVISPNNRTFPQNFNLGRLTKTFVKQSLGGKLNNKQDVYLNVSSPYSGYWFSAAFIDSNDQQVKPDLLKSNCSFYLTASINLWQINDTQVLYPNASLQSLEHDMFKIYKYISVSNDLPLTFKMSLVQKNNNKLCSLTALVRQSAFPDMTSFKANDDYILCNSTSNVSSCKITVDYPVVNQWYYIGITSDCEYKLEVIPTGDCDSYFLNSINTANSSVNTTFSTTLSSLSSSTSNLLLNCPKSDNPIETFRFIGPTYFSVKYYFNSNYNRSNALLVRNQNKPYFIEFLVDLANNGGTLNFQIINNLIYDPSYLELSQIYLNTPNLVNNNSTNSTLIAYEQFINNQAKNTNKMKDFNLADVKVMLHACLLYNSMNNYKKCPPGYQVVVQSVTNVYNNVQLNVAYPFIGKWYLAVWKECLDAKSK